MHENIILGIVISHKFQEEGVHFFTPDNYSQQLGHLKHSAGTKIKAHTHNRIKREVHYTQEVLILKRGKLRVDFYSEDRIYVESVILKANDVVLLASGGHGFEVLEDVEMIEVKQGYYTGEMDKTIFEGIKGDELVIRN